MLVFAAVAYDEPSRSETIFIDETLFRLIGEGDRDAFCELYSLTRSAVYSYALSLLHNESDAEDVMQDTYLKIRSAAHLYRPQGKPMAWILTIERNLCLMKFRQRKTQSVIPIEDAANRIDFSQIEDREDRIVLETALNSLSREECQIIVLHAVSGLKHREIGNLLEMPLSTVLSKYNRGIKKLQRLLEEAL
jgi:RNA polymerase sigma-70 factor (ECF subfamily)